MSLRRCCCQLARNRYRATELKKILCPSLRYASSSTSAGPSTSTEDKLVRLASQTLNKANAEIQNGSSNEIESAKRTKQLEGLKQALKNWEEIFKLRQSLQDVLDNDKDKEMQELAAIDLASVRELLIEASDRLQTALLPQDDTSSLGCLMEIKAGVGGSEASIFAGDLMRMYSRYATSRQWKSDIVDASAVGATGGTDAFREVILEVDGQGAYSALRHEAGVHRVQRVPATETQGRVHTSTASVIVLPSGSEYDPSMDKVLDEKDVRVEVMRSGGAGGQHVNRTESAVRLTHIPSGITVSIQETRSQHKNRAKAYQVLRARLLAVQLAEKEASDRAQRRAQVRGQDRSEKIRTYNFAQDRVTDHRLPLTLSGVQGFLEGDKGTTDIMVNELQQWSLDQQIEDRLEDLQ